MAEPDHPVGNTSNQEALESTASVGAHDDQVDTVLRYEMVRVHGGWKGMGFSEARRDRADVH
jgi:hypothetical protein